MFCSKCGFQNADSAKFCSECAAPLSGPSGQPDSKSSSKLLLWLLLGAISLIVIISASISNHDGEQLTPPAGQGTTPRTGNIANDKLLALSAAEQAYALGAIVNDNCTGDKVFYMGIDATDNGAFWSVHCVGGGSYEVEVSANAAGTTKVLNCSVLKAIGGGECFRRFKGQ